VEKTIVCSASAPLQAFVKSGQVFKNGSSSANAAELRSLDFGWRRSCTASGPPLRGSLGSTGQLRLRPWLLPPACPRRACRVGFGLLCLEAFLPRFFLAPVAPQFFALRFLDCLSLNVLFLLAKLKFLSPKCWRGWRLIDRKGVPEELFLKISTGSIS
jgi:hypothetical protein